MPRQFYGSWHTRVPWRTRFWAKVRKGLGKDSCWIWTCHFRPGRRPQEKRARFKDGGKWWSAARFIWTKLYGPIPEGQQVLHTCDNPMCVRPKHLWLGTQLENIEDMRAKGRARTNPKRGDESSSSKITSLDVRRLKKLREEGWKLRELEEEFGISQAQISRIANGHRWSHLS